MERPLTFTVPILGKRPATTRYELSVSSATTPGLPTGHRLALGPHQRPVCRVRGQKAELDVAEEAVVEAEVHVADARRAALVREPHGLHVTVGPLHPLTPTEVRGGRVGVPRRSRVEAAAAGAEHLLAGVGVHREVEDHVADVLEHGVLERSGGSVHRREVWAYAADGEEVAAEVDGGSNAATA